MASTLSSRAAFGVFGTAAFFVACASFTSANEPPGGQGDGGPSADAGDTLPSADGGGPGSDGAADGSGALTCATATFCADFEQPPPDQGLTLVSDAATITHSVMSSGNGGSTKSVRFELQAGAYDNQVHYLRKVFGIPNATLLTVRFAMRIASAPVPNNMQIATIGWGPSTDTDKPSEIQIRLENDKILAKLDEDPQPGVDIYGESSFFFTRDVWFDVAVNMTFSGRGVALEVTANGQTLMGKAFTSLSDPLDPDVGIGITGVDGDAVGAVTVDFDDLIVVAK